AALEELRDLVVVLHVLHHGRPAATTLGCPASTPLTGPLTMEEDALKVVVMRAALFHEPHRVEAGDRPDASIVESTDAVVRVAFACVCGSDLWYYRGDSPFEPGPIGHEFIGVVEDIGPYVANVRRGDLVI